MGALKNLRPWAKLLRDYTVASFAVQGLTLAASLVVVNVLDVRDYALFTLGLSGVVFLSIASDLGIGNAMLFFSRKCEKEGASQAPFWAAAMRLRLLFLSVASFLLGVFLVHEGLSQDFSIVHISAMVMLVTLTGWFAVTGSLNGLQLRIDGKFRASYLADILGQLTKVSLILLGAAFSLLSAISALFAGLAGAIVHAVSSRRFNGSRNHSAQPGEIPINAFVRYIIPTLPGALYFAVQGPLLVALCSFFGNFENVAEVGALGRLGLIINVFGGFFVTVALPRLARIQDDAEYLKRYILWLLLYIGFSLALVACAILFPGSLLVLLGVNYSHLTTEVLWVAVSASLSMLGSFSVSINHARGWIRYQPYGFVLYFLTQLLLVLLMDLTSTANVIIFGLLSAGVGFLIQLTFNLIGLKNPSKMLVGSGMMVRHGE